MSIFPKNLKDIQNVFFEPQKPKKKKKEQTSLSKKETKKL